MSPIVQRIVPAVPRRTLMLLAGLVWMGVGGMLLRLAVDWLGHGQAWHPYLLGGAGALAALVIHHFGFLRVANRNLERILRMTGKRCAFAFMSWRSYLLVVVMMAMGLALRHSPIPKPMLAVLYVGIGLGLVLSAFRYLRVFFTTPADVPPSASG
jgi:hypothetical protein